jgi:hypothetical protein
VINISIKSTKQCIETLENERTPSQGGVKDYESQGDSGKYVLCLFNVKSKEETRTFVSSVISKHPDNLLLNRLLGRSLLYLNDHADALKYLQKGSEVIKFDTEGVNYLL